MELAICFLDNGELLYGIDNHFIIYKSFTYSAISTQRKVNRLYRCINNIIQPNIRINHTINIEIIQRIQVTDAYGYIYECAIYYTYLLRIIQVRWRKKMELRKKYNQSLFVNFIKRRETEHRHIGSKRDTGIVGLFYGNLVFN